jgi:OmpA-OmpF porin, OOP family
MNMQKLLLALLTVLWFVLGTWWFTNSSCSSCNTTAASVSTTASAISSPSWPFTDSNWSYQSAAHLRFANSGSVPVVSAAVNTALDTVTAHGKQYAPGKKIIVTGFYKTAEKNTSSFENLGFARAEAVKALLTAKGYDAKLISTASIADDANRYTLTADTLYGGATIDFAANAIAPVVAQAPANDSLGYTVYFSTGQADKNVEDGLRKFLAKANAYMKTHPGKQLLVTGHTDNQGDAAKNQTLSENRAVYVKGLLVKNGVPNTGVTTAGKGQTDPIADNNTTAGMAKNRRVQITVQ